jgi:hypothetical protein
MADNKKSFVAYCDWGEIFDELDNEEAGKLVKHLFDYVRDKNPKAEDKLTKMMFIQIQQSLKRDLVKYENYIDKQSLNGKKGGRPKNPKNPTLFSKTQPLNGKPKKADSVNDSVNVNDIKKTKGFAPPTLLEVKEYFKEKGYSEASAIKAFNYYEAGNWKDSKGQKVKSWKQKMQGVWFKDENKSRANGSIKVNMFQS